LKSFFILKRVCSITDSGRIRRRGRGDHALDHLELQHEMHVAHAPREAGEMNSSGVEML